MMKRLRRHRHGSVERVHGQAMVEMIIVSLFFLVPLFLFMTMLMKYLDMRSATMQASRYVAFERTVYSASGHERDATMAKLDDASLLNATRVRFFGRGVDSINQGQNAGGNSFQGLALWSDAHGNALLKQSSDVGGSVGGGSEPTLAFAPDFALKETLGTWNSLIPSELEGLNGFSLTYDKYYSANIQVTPARPKPDGTHPQGLKPDEPFHAWPTLTFRDHDVLLADGWSASDVNYEHDQAARAVPTGVAKILSDGVLGDVIDAVGKLGMPDLFGGLGVHGDLFKSLGFVQVDKAGDVPADRLKDYQSPSNPGGGDKDLSEEIKQVKKQFADKGFSYVGQTKNSDGSVTLKFKDSKSGATVTYTVGGNGGDSEPNTQKIKESVQKATNDTISSFGNQGYSVKSSSHQCAYDGLGNCMYWTSSETTMEKTVSYGGNSSKSTVTIKVVRDPDDSDYADVTIVTHNEHN